MGATLNTHTEVQGSCVCLFVPQRSDTRSLRTTQPQHHASTQGHALIAGKSLPVLLCWWAFLHPHGPNLLLPTPSHAQRGEEPPHSGCPTGMSYRGRPRGASGRLQSFETGPGPVVPLRWFLLYWKTFLMSYIFFLMKHSL